MSLSVGSVIEAAFNGDVHGPADSFNVCRHDVRKLVADACTRARIVFINMDPTSVERFLDLASRQLLERCSHQDVTRLWEDLRRETTYNRRDLDPTIIKRAAESIFTRDGSDNRSRLSPLPSKLTLF